MDLDARRTSASASIRGGCALAHRAAERRLQPEAVRGVLGERQLGDSAPSRQLGARARPARPFSPSSSSALRGPSQRARLDPHVRALHGDDVAGRALDGARRQPRVGRVAVGDAHVADQRRRRHGRPFEQRRPAEQRAQPEGQLGEQRRRAPQERDRRRRLRPRRWPPGAAAPRRADPRARARARRRRGTRAPGPPTRRPGRHVHCRARRRQARRPKEGRWPAAAPACRRGARPRAHREAGALAAARPPRRRPARARRWSPSSA